MMGQPEPCVVIGGDGIAASALACVLRDSGFGVILIPPRRRRSFRGVIIEALPQAAVHLMHDIGLTQSLLAAAPVAVSGFDNRYAERQLAGVWTHVDRARLAERCFTEARRRGATVVRQPAPQAPADQDATPRIRLGGNDIPVFALVDATGRPARWSRPVRRALPATAAVYAGPGAVDPGCGVVDYVGDRWAYRLDHPTASTLGVIGKTACPEPELARLAAAVGVDSPRRLTLISTCCASVQWADQPVRRRQLAIGDAALALNPIAGQGIRFALSSALAAAAVLRTWADGQEELASAYYRSYVAGVRERHLAKLRGLHRHRDRVPSHDVTVPGDSRFAFVAPSRFVGQNRDGRIVAAECFVLADGGLVRTVGGVELHWLREAAACNPTFTELCDALIHHDMGGESATLVVGWALRHGVLACT